MNQIGYCVNFDMQYPSHIIYTLIFSFTGLHLMSIKEFIFTNILNQGIILMITKATLYDGAGFGAC